MTRLILLIAALLWSAVADAQECAGTQAPVEQDGRVLGHLPYGNAADAELVEAPPGFALRGGCRIRREVYADLERLLAAAGRDAAAIGTLRGLSCQRGVIRQSGVFCRGSDGDAADRAISVAPPGHSEHSTGYAIDFAVRPQNGCPDAEACMAATPAWRWLAANAPRYGFEMSFPGGNKQQVKWEPWHWRWVGIGAGVPGAARARFVFARARREFPADPAVLDPVVLRDVPPPPVWVDAPAYPVGKQKKRRGR
jgi:D-alanyl-D-alanine carboxypeptidase